MKLLVTILIVVIVTAQNVRCDEYLYRFATSTRLQQVLDGNKGALQYFNLERPDEGLMFKAVMRNDTLLATFFTTEYSSTYKLSDTVLDQFVRHLNEYEKYCFNRDHDAFNEAFPALAYRYFPQAKIGESDLIRVQLLDGKVIEGTLLAIGEQSFVMNNDTLGRIIDDGVSLISVPYDSLLTVARYSFRDDKDAQIPCHGDKTTFLQALCTYLKYKPALTSSVPPEVYLLYAGQIVTFECSSVSANEELLPTFGNIRLSLSPFVGVGGSVARGVVTTHYPQNEVAFTQGEYVDSTYYSEVTGVVGLQIGFRHKASSMIDLGCDLSYSTYSDNSSRAFDASITADGHLINVLATASLVLGRHDVGWYFRHSASFSLGLGARLYSVGIYARADPYQMTHPYGYDKRIETTIEERGVQPLIQLQFIDGIRVGSSWSILGSLGAQYGFNSDRTKTVYYRGAIGAYKVDLNYRTGPPLLFTLGLGVEYVL